MKSLAAVFFSLLLVLSLGAQTSPSGARQPDAKAKPTEKPPAATKTAEAKSVPGALPQPAPEITRFLNMTQGRWETAEKYDVSEMTPQGGEGKGQESFRPGPGKMSAISEYNSIGPLGEFAGVGIITWNPAEKLYYIHWTDNTNPVMTMLTGRWQGDDLVFTGSDLMKGKKVYSRHTYSDITPTTFTYTIETGPAPNQLKRAMTIKYTKVNMEQMRNRLFRGQPQ